MGLPHYNGKVNNIDHFDAQFFHIHPKDANFMEPQMRILHEVVYEAIWDAGKWIINDQFLNHQKKTHHRFSV